MGFRDSGGSIAKEHGGITGSCALKKAVGWNIQGTYLDCKSVAHRSGFYVALVMMII